jgi:hypothetical protein
VTFKANYEGIGEMLRKPYMQEAMKARAERGKEFAEGIAPVDETGDHPGRYKESFHVHSGVRHRKTARAFAQLSNDSPEAPYVEHGNGTAKYQGDHVLSRALEIMAK